METFEVPPGGDEVRRSVEPPVASLFDAGRPLPLLLTVEEAADLLRISRSHIYEYILSGRIRSVKLGWSRRIPPSALDEFITELTAEQRDAPSGQW